MLVAEFFKVLGGLLVFLGDDFKVRLDRVHADDVVVLRQIHTVHTAGVASHGAHFGFAEEDGLAVMAREEDHLLAVGELGADEFVLGLEVDRDDARRMRVGKFGERGFFHRAELRGHEDIAPFFLQLLGGDERGQLFVFLELHEVGDGFAARGRRGFRKLVNLQPVNAALRSKQENVAVRRGNEEMLDKVLFPGLRADAAFAPAGLVAVDLDRRALDVARVAYGNEHVGIGDQVFELDLVDLVDDLSAPVISVGLVNFPQLAGDDALQFPLARKDFLEFGDPVADRFQLLQNFVDRKLGQAVQLEFEDSVDLHVRQGQAARAARTFDFRRALQAVLAAVELDARNLARLAVLGDGEVLLAEILEQVFPRVGAAGAAADDANRHVEVVEGDLVAEQDVFPLAGLAQLIARTARDDVAAVLDKKPHEFKQAHLAGLAAHDRQQDHAERLLHLGVLEEIVQDELRFFAALQLDDNAHAIAVALVADVSNAFDLFVGDEFRDALDELGFVNLVRNFGDDNVFAILAGFFDCRLGAHGEAAAAGLVGLLDAFAAGDVAAGRKVRAGNELHRFLQCEFRLFDHRDRGVNHFAEVVGRDVGGHADRNTAGAVNEKIRNARGQDERLFFGFVEVGNEVDGFLLDVGEQFLGDLGETRFRVPHRCGHIAVDGPEVALAVNQGITHVEVLRHAHERVVNRRVAVRVILAEDFADDLGAFAVGLARGQTEFVHAKKNAAMHGLQAVADLRQRAPDDYAHGVIKVGLAHFGFDVYREKNRLVLFVSHYFLSQLNSGGNDLPLRPEAAKESPSLSPLGKLFSAFCSSKHATLSSLWRRARAHKPSPSRRRRPRC